MTYKAIEYITPDDIKLTRKDGTALVIDEKTAPEMWAEVAAGVFGDVAAYVPPPAPTMSEQIEAWRGVTHCDMVRLQDAIIDQGLFDKAEKLSEKAGQKWRNRWNARAGVVVFRNSPELAEYAEALIGKDPTEWLDNLPVWVHPFPAEVSQ